MANIFDEIYKFSHEDLCYELALIDSISVSNVAKAFTNKAVAKIFNATNHLLSSVTDSRLDYKGADNIKTLVKEKQVANLLKTREELMQNYKARIVDKLAGLGMVEADATDDVLSVRIIDESAVLYKINENLTPYQKADLVHKKFNENYINHLYKALCGQNYEDAQATDELIFKEIVALPVDYRIRLKNTLFVDEFNQKGIGKALRGALGRKVLTRLVEFVGYEPFANADTMVGMVYNGFAEFNRPERAVLAYIVWKVIMVRGKGYSISDDVLPSYIISTQRERESKKEKQHIELSEGYTNTKHELTKLRMEVQEDKENYAKKLSELNILYSKRETYKIKYEMAVNKNKDISKRLDTAKAELDLYIDNNLTVDRNDPRYKSLKEDNNFYAKSLKASEKELVKISQSVREYFDDVKAREETVNTLKKKIELLESRIGKLEDTFTDVSKKYDYAMDFEYYKLKTKWLTCFMDLAFEENVLKSVVKDFNHSQILNIERALVELTQATDIMAYSKGKLKKKDSNLNYMPFVPSEGSEGMIIFTRSADTGKKAFIAAIAKNIKE